jgi:transcriptional regulator with XRE-family HTH domain
MSLSEEAGSKVRSARKRRGLTQADLSRLSGVSLSLVRKLEQGEYGNIRLETLHKLATALAVPTSALVTGPDAPVPAPEATMAWEPVRRALEESPGTEPSSEPTLEGIKSAFRGMLPLLLASQFTEISAVLPGLLRDADALVAASPEGSAATAARTLRAQIRQVTGALMTHVWQFSTAERAFDLALADASDPLTAIAVTEERCWGLIRQGRLAETQELAYLWADEHQPAMTAHRNELAAWGRLLIRASNAAVRDNRPAEARDALRLARMAAAGTDRDFVLPYSPWHVFGPVTVQVVAAENATIEDQPAVTLTIAAQLEGARMPVPRYAPSHRLDVAHAHMALRQYPEAVTVLRQLRHQRPQWLPHQRYATDILTKIIHRRRSLTPEMRDLAGFMRLTL